MAQKKADKEAKVRPEVQVTTPKRKIVVGGFDKGWVALRSMGEEDGWPVHACVIGYERIEEKK